MTIDFEDLLKGKATEETENVEVDDDMIDELNSLLPFIKMTIEKYKPFVYELFHEVVKILNDYSNNTELPAISARITKNQYDAFIAAGFSEDQAFSLLMENSIQAGKSSAELSKLVKQIIDLMENK